MVIGANLGGASLTAALGLVPHVSRAQNVGLQNGIVTGVQQGQAAGGMSPTPQTRNTFQVNNAINYWQYQQTTGMGPSIGWVRIITQFPQNGQQSGSGGGLNSGFTGNANLGGGGGAGNQQPNNGGSDPPSGVFLAANYGTLVGLPLQQQQQQQQQQGFGGGLGNQFGIGGNRFGLGGNQFGAKGFGGVGNGGSGL
jgi:hypothetical protein